MGVSSQYWPSVLAGKLSLIAQHDGAAFADDVPSETVAFGAAFACCDDDGNVNASAVATINAL